MVLLNGIRKMALMKIDLCNAGKRFNREWIFRKANLQFNSGNAYAITGPNGSGKSTLLQSIAGMLQLSEGSVSYQQQDKSIEPEQVYQQISFCAPYFDIIEEMTLSEFLNFHFQFKPVLNSCTIGSIIEEIGLNEAANKEIRFYSSGMKQRVKLAQSIFAHTSIVLLDEPCSNLDERGINLYHALIDRYCKDRLVIVCSNDKAEYAFCTQIISVTDFK